MTTPLQQAALEYLAAGLHLLALTGKRPNSRVHGESWSYELSFFNDDGLPPTDHERDAIETAFSEEASGTTGIAILIPPQCYVADVDTEEAAALMAELGWTGATDDSVAAKTKNGLHVWFVEPGTSQNRWAGGRTLLFKGHGGYVVAPPSLHFGPDGKVDGTYQWGSRPLVIDGRLQMPDLLPTPIRELFTMENQYVATKVDKEAMTHFTMTYDPALKWWQWPVVREYNMAGLEKAIENAQDGNQNSCIMWAASVAQEEGVPYDVAMERLLAAARKGNHPRKRAYDTIRGVYKRRGDGYAERHRVARG